MHHMPDSRNWFPPTPEIRRRSFNRAQRQGMHIEVQGRVLLNFAANDYLGLSLHPGVCHAAQEAIAQHGMGSGASRLVSGDDPLLHDLEAELAAWKGFEAAMLVGSGMLANMGLLPALADRHSTLFCDRLNHASLVDGARLAGCRVARYAHLDTAQLAELMQADAASGSHRKLIVSDGVFSMDGDCADLTALMALAEAHDGLLLLDDAHGFGVLGEGGRGLSRECALAGHARLVEVGTCGKSLGSYGAFILGTQQMIEGLRQRLRSMTYSTALPPAVCAASLAALHIVKDGEVVHRLHERLDFFRKQAALLDLPLMDSHTPIQGLLLGSEARAMDAAARLRDESFFVPAIRPPTVPEGTARLRITISAAHSHADIQGLSAALRRVLDGINDLDGVDEGKA